MSRLLGAAGGRRGAGAAAALAVAASAALLPATGASDPVLLDAALAVLAAGPAAAAALALAAGRPALCMPGLGAAGGYAAGLTVLHGGGWFEAVAAGTAVAAALGAAIGLLGAGLGPAGFLALTLLATLGGRALVAAMPDRLGGDAGLGPLPAAQVSLPDGSVAVLGPAGLFHAALLAAAASALVAAVLAVRGPGPWWRAAGGDRGRAAATRLRPLLAEVSVLAVAGALAGLCGAVAAAVAGSVTPGPLGVDAAGLALAAALLAGSSGPAVAALLAAAAAVAAGVLLPHAGYVGPPSASALSTTALVAAALVAATLVRRRPIPAGRVPAVEPGGAWPVEPPLAGPAALRVRALPVRAGGEGPLLLPALDLDVEPGTVTGLVGRNGSGKTSALRSVEAALRQGGGGARLEGQRGARAATMPQLGGGLPGCTVAEALRLAARAGGRGRHAATAAAGTWLDRLALRPLAGVDCGRLPHGARRRVELARVLLLRPALLLCDEPLAGLDPAERAAVLDCLRAAAAAGAGVLLVEHDRVAVAGLARTIVELERAPAPEPSRVPG